MIGNESAYPQVKTEWPNSNYHNTFSVGGLTKRELLAAMVMQGFAADPNGGETSIERIADYSVRWADALLAQLSKEPT